VSEPMCAGMAFQYRKLAPDSPAFSLMRRVVSKTRLLLHDKCRYHRVGMSPWDLAARVNSGPLGRFGLGPDPMTLAYASSGVNH